MAQAQMFSQMEQAALARLTGRDPLEIGQKTGVIYDERTQAFCISSLGIDVSVGWPDCSITPRLSAWHSLLILHYLDLADGFPLTGKDIPFGQMKSGMVRGGGIDRKCELAIQKLAVVNEDSVAEMCERLGGELISSNADITIRIPFLPRFPVTLKLWLPDEEFPASGRLLVDAAADHYLTIEDAVTVAELLLEKLQL